MYERLLNKYAINQLGYVVDNLERAARTHSKLFGSGPFVYFTPPEPVRTMFQDKEVRNTMDVAYGMYGDLQIELIKPTSSDPTPYTVPGRLGFNHFSVWVDDFDGAVKDFANCGFEVAMLMVSSGGLEVAYIDCLDAWGHYVEIHNPQPYLIDMCKTLAENWDGTDPFRAMGS